MGSSYLTLMQRIHVMVVDHESRGLVNIVKLLEMCQYRVIVAELASAAITMLASGNPKFDIVLADINSPDLHGFKLIHQANSLGIPIIVMSDADNAFIAAKAIENGAYLCIKKHATREMLSTCLWQCVLKEKMRTKMSKRLGTGEGAEIIRESTDQNSNSVVEGGEYNRGKKKPNGRKDSNNNELEEMGSEMNNSNKKRAFTEWTQELHEKFIAAVQQLGEGRCFPKEILDLMNVPGLTRMQVASHLQKCRNNNWRAPEERKSSDNLQPMSPDDISVGGSQAIREKRFGTMPRVRKPIPTYPVQIQLTAGCSGSITLPQNDNNGRVGNFSTSLDHIVNLITYHPNYDLNPNPNSNLGGGGRGSSSSNPHSINHQASEDQYFCFQDMDCLIQDFPGFPGQAFATGVMGGGPDPGATTAGYHIDQQLYQDQNASMAGMDARGYWDTSGQ